jgi:hypothetical protein
MEEIKDVTSETIVESSPQEEQMKAQPELREDQKAYLAVTKNTQLFVNKLTEYEGSKQCVIRAWANSAVSPFNTNELHFSYAHEKELFDLYAEQNSAKLILMMYGLERAGVVKILKPLMEESTQVEIEKTRQEVEQETQLSGITG